MRTFCTVSFGSNAFAIKEDSSIAMLNGGLQPFADLDALESGTVPSAPYATYEPNYWLLDGNFKFAPSTNARGGWVSTAMSGAAGGFDFAASVPDIRITFSEDHDTDGLTLYFSGSGDYADDIDIAFYDSGAVLIRTDAYTPSSATFATGQAVANFRRIDIFINSTNRAQRYARLRAIDFDALTQFTGAQIKAARVIEQINPLSLELPSNTIELELFSSDGDFSIVEPAGFYAGLELKQPLDVYEDIDGSTIYIGRFYLDKWQSKSATLATFEASDAINLLGQFNYVSEEFFGEYWFGSTIDSEDLILEIMTAAGLDYELDASLTGIAIRGWLPIFTCREALQNVALAIGAYVTCARSNVIQIKPFELASDLVSYDHTLTSAEKGIDSPIELRPLVTGVEIKEFRILNSYAITPKTIFSDTLATGFHTINFNDWVAGTSDSGTAVLTYHKSTPRYVYIEVTTAGTLILDQTDAYAMSEKLRTITSGLTPQNVVVIHDATLISSLNGNTIKQRVYDYYSQRYLQRTRLFGSLIAPGDSVLVDVQNAKQLAGIIERMETDLAGGYISQVEIVGVII